jgi:hypothetical protein
MTEAFAHCGFCGREIGPGDGYGASRFFGIICGVRNGLPDVPPEQTCWGKLNAESIRFNELQGSQGGIVDRTQQALCAAARVGDKALVLTLAQELFDLEKQRRALGTVKEHFERFEKQLREELWRSQ